MRVLFLNPQGNFDKDDSYWTEHPDFGGQLVYVKEIASEIAKLGHHVDIITRYLDDENFPAIKGTFDTYNDIDNLRIIRIPCGPHNKYINKEYLWEHLYEWVENIIDFYEKEQIQIDIATGHYGDGGLSCAILKEKLHIPYTFTGHSLGAQKFDKLFKTNQNCQELEDTYQFSKRLLAENNAIINSDMIFVSTKQEQLEQYSHDLYKEHSSNKSFTVVPPGANDKVFHPFKQELENQQITNKIESILSRDISENRRSLSYIIAASRLDPKKNHLGLLESFALNKELQDKANIVISLRGIDNAFIDYSSASSKEQELLQNMLHIIDSYQLYGKVSFMNIMNQYELAETYRYFSVHKGIFTLTALYEPFGLAPIEAMSAGLPVVVTKYGGPSDVLEEDGKPFGVLVDVYNKEDISKGLLQAINSYEFYQVQGRKRVLEKYTWKIAAKSYMDTIQNMKTRKELIEPLPEYFKTKNEQDLSQHFICNYIK